MRYRDIIEGDVVPFPKRQNNSEKQSEDPEMPEGFSMGSFIAMMTHSGNTYDLYDVGDCLTYHGEDGVVTKCNPTSLLIEFPSGTKVVKRNDIDLEVTPFERWKR